MGKKYHKRKRNSAESEARLTQNEHCETLCSFQRTKFGGKFPRSKGKEWSTICYAILYLYNFENEQVAWGNCPCSGNDPLEECFLQDPVTVNTIHIIHKGKFNDRFQEAISCNILLKNWFRIHRAEDCLPLLARLYMASRDHTVYGIMGLPATRASVTVTHSCRSQQEHLFHGDVRGFSSPIKGTLPRLSHNSRQKSKCQSSVLLKTLYEWPQKCGQG